jgi:protein-tyrosine phosphatase
MKRVLFVCLGNICRSPLAEGLARAKARRAGLDLQFDSAGTESYHVGRPPDPRACAVARARGVPIDDLRARQVTREDFGNFDLILAADQPSLRVLQSLRPAQGGAELALLLERAEAGRRHGRERDAGTAAGAPAGDSAFAARPASAAATAGEVPDPYYGDEADFERVYDLLDRALDALLPHVAGA